MSFGVRICLSPWFTPPTSFHGERLYLYAHGPRGIRVAIHGTPPSPSWLLAALPLPFVVPIWLHGASPSIHPLLLIRLCHRPWYWKEEGSRKHWQQ
ncbi:Os06g0222700 [Oryza sativa Japonica Group]|uniref:Os06g0222700 protein n=1 Tax=Oryza sativa subsp. japonica TaxID=39947 RepID=A0A0N7KLS6_ORYSJ|nr:Os06g0222700 [Oryza sativa Japonica Group]